MKTSPLLIQPSTLLLLAIIFLSIAVARYSDRRAELKIARPIIYGLILAIVAARLAFVWQYKTFYLNAPMTILDVRDGGWDQQTGLIVGWIFSFVLVRRVPARRKSILLIVCSASIVWMAGALTIFVNTTDQNAMPGDALKDLAGRSVMLSDFHGKPTVINFWATWCPPCQEEMPALERAQSKRPDVNFVFINQAESGAIVKSFLAVGRLNLKNVLLDPTKTVARDFSVLGYPTTLFFDASGKLVVQHTGILTEATLNRSLEKIGSSGSGRITSGLESRSR